MTTKKATMFYDVYSILVDKSCSKRRELSFLFWYVSLIFEKQYNLVNYYINLRGKKTLVKTVQPSGQHVNQGPTLSFNSQFLSQIYLNCVKTSKEILRRIFLLRSMYYIQHHKFPTTLNTTTKKSHKKDMVICMDDYVQQERYPCGKNGDYYELK
jgi:hypothetical protein